MNCMYYVLIKGLSYKNLDYEDRELVRKQLRERLENNGIRFLEYNWVWDEEDRCLLVVGKYQAVEDAYWWIRALENMGFEICVREHLPGEDT